MPGNIDASFRVVKEKQNSPSRLMQWSAIKFEKKKTRRDMLRTERSLRVRAHNTPTPC